MIRLLAVTFLVLSAQVGAQNLHVFEDGQTIDAQRFNENFTALKNGIVGSESNADNVAVIGRPVWVDSNANVITGRGESSAIWWRINGADTRVGAVSNDLYYHLVGTRYYTEADCAGTEYVDNRDMVWADGGAWKTSGEPLTIEKRSVKYFSTYTGTVTEDCNNSEGSEEVRPTVDTGLAAPSWTSDGTKLYPALR